MENIFKKLFDVLIFSETPTLEKDKNSIYFSSTPFAITLKKNAQSTFIESLYKLYSLKENDFSDNFTLSSFQKTLFKYFEECYIKNKDASFQDFFNYTQNIGLINMKVGVRISGIFLEEDIILGKYRLYKYQESSSNDFKYRNGDTILEVVCQAKARDKLLEKAENYFEFFLNLFYIFIGNSSSINIFTNRSKYLLNEYILYNLNNDKSSFYSGFNSNPTLFEFKDISAEGVEVLKKIYEKISITPTTQLNEKLLTSINWLGKAYRYPKNSGILNAIIALETLLSDKGKSASSLSQRVAFFLVKDKTERKRIQKDIKKLYKLRSNIVHEGSYIHNKTFLNLLIYYARQVIFRLLLDDSLDKITSIKDLKIYIDKN